MSKSQMTRTKMSKKLARNAFVLPTCLNLNFKIFNQKKFVDLQKEKKKRAA